MVVKVGVLVSSYNSDDWGRVLAGDYSRSPMVPDRDVIDNTWLFASLVEPLGFDTLWTTEHYGSPYAMQGNPLQFLSYWAGRTERIDMGTAVLVLPWWDPVRLATEMSMLDLMLEGRRLIPGVGRGVAASEYASLRIPREESRDRFYEVLDVLRLADSEEEFSYDGRYYKIPPTSIRPQGRHRGRLLENLRGAFTTRASVERGAVSGVGQMFVAGESLDLMSRHFAKFNEARVGAGYAPDQPTAVLFTRCVPREIDDDEMYRYFLRYTDESNNHYAKWKNPGFSGVAGYEDYVKMDDPSEDFGARAIAAQKASHLIGTPDQIIEKVRAVQEAISMDHLIINLSHGGIPLKESTASIELFAKEVLPVLQAMETPLHPHSLGTSATTA
jgi:alkanesulfonate monooxygenase SsuD/methylene tetrahydromethanopterin reductase-like flavin-dependent oxidoreductase (luciferase family)